MTAPNWLVPAGPARITTRHRYHAGHHPELVMPVELVVIHYSASPWTPGPRRGSDLRRHVNWLTGAPGRVSSTHLDTLRDGTLLQGCPLSDRAWHAGGSAWVAPDGVHRGDINARSIGFDFDNAGRIIRDGGQTRDLRGNVHPGPRWRDMYGNAYDGPEPVQAGPHGWWWEPYTRPALETFLCVVPHLVEAFPVLADRRRWVGHEDIKASKYDPGPLFPWGLLDEALIQCVDPEQVDWDRFKGVVA